MSCTELGLSEYSLRVSKSADSETIGTAPTTTSLTGYTAEFVVRASENTTPLLTVTTTPSANGSVIVIAGNLLTLRLKKADIITLPDNATDANDPYEGVCEFVVTAPTGLRSRVWFLPIIVEKGVAR